MEKKRSKLNIVFFVLAILAPILIAGIAIGVIRAWYTNVIQTGDLDATTKNMSIKYTINGSNENITTYNITNLVFFDSNSQDEGPYLNSMSFHIELSLTNNSSDDVSYTIKVESTKTILEDDDDNEISKAYVACVYDSTAVDTTNHKTVDSYLANNEATQAAGVTYENATTSFTATKESTSNLAVNENVKVQLYIFGIQDIDSALSQDFLYTDTTKADTRSYNFKITIIAEPKGSPVVTENTTVTTN
ncbi:MAG: hypothetical protein IKN46_00620 [Acholeplasmatales bacterium]|nr:hypothetical protein [Acholeplasmatales bacterium]